MIAFGPVPSRRLGKSLGVNNIPPKVCTYSCIYCQVGRTTKMQVERRPFYEPEDILKGVRDKVEKAKEMGDQIDYLTFVPDGEPTLDANLGGEIEMLKALDIKIAVITNSSLLWREDVRDELVNADWVSVKVDSTKEDNWRRINHPHRALSLPSILDGILKFAESYRGKLAVETMLVKGINDSEEHAQSLADFLAGVPNANVYLSIPIRPPAVPGTFPPDEDVINRFYQTVGKYIDRVEYLIGYEGNAFASTGKIDEDLLSITAVHPMREDAVTEILKRAGADWSVVNRLLSRKQLRETKFRGHVFYVRALRRAHRSPPCTGCARDKEVG